MARQRLFILYYFGLTVAVFQIQGELSTSISVSETDAAGSVLLKKTSSNKCSVKSLDPWQPETYVIFTDQNVLVTTKPLDLEVLTLEGNSSILTVHYLCDNREESLSINITPVNEFKPKFIGAPFDSKVKEDSAIGSQVLFLGDKWRDGDYLKYGNEATFDLHGYVITAFDGRDHFKMDNETGNITTSIELDYESLTWNFFFLNISVQDDGGLIDFSTVNITILDIDDNPPIFTSCGDISERCHVTYYTASTNRFFQGRLSVRPTSFSPPRILAKDRDRGIDAKILYTLESDDEMASNIQINNVTGEVEVVLPYDNLTTWTEYDVLKNVSLNVTATEESVNGYHTSVSLTVLVYRDLPTTTISPPTSESMSTSPPSTTTSGKSEPESQIDPILLIEIVIPVFVAAIIVIFIVCLVRNRKRRQRDTRYKLSESLRLEKNRKSKNYENESIDVISSTPVSNSYELINMYARMGPDRSSKEGNKESSKTEDAVSTGKEGGQYEVSKGIANVQRETTGKGGEFYSKVRKPRKRQNHGMAFLNNAFDNVEHVENQSNRVVSGPDSGHDMYKNIDECYENQNEPDDLSLEEANTGHTKDVKECFETAIDSPKHKSGDYSRYSSVDDF